MPKQYLFIFKYQRVGWCPEGEIPIKRPSVQILLKNKGKEIKTPCLLDSGADRTFLTPDLADYLELELSDKYSEIRTPGNPIKVKTTEVEMSVVKGKDYYSIGKVKCNVFSKSRPDLPPIIGREPFFDHFDISFNQKRNEVRIRHYKFHDY